MKKKRLYKNRKKYAFGGTPIKNYIETPEEAMANHRIDVAKAQYEGATSNVTRGFQIGGAALSQLLELGAGYAQGKSGGGTNASDINFNKGAGDIASGGVATSKTGEALDMTKLKSVEDFASAYELSQMQFPQFAFGGEVGDVPVEVEGKEVAETPEGELMEFQGPDHEQGGIDVDLPSGTDIYSKRLRIGGKTMAQRKKARERRLSRVQKRLEESPSDAILKKTLERVLANNEAEELSDMDYQEEMKAQMEAQQPQEREEFFGGGTVEHQLPSVSEALGLAGTIYSGVKPLQNTLANRADDTANINPFEDFGQDALAAIDSQKIFVAQQEANKLKDLEGQRLSALKRGRNSARSANTQRALDIASTQSANKASGDIRSQATKEMQQILGEQAKAENIQDQYVMEGESMRDTADRHDKDAFYTALSTNQVGLGRSLQEASKILNKVASNNEKRNLINSRSANFKIDKRGNVTAKDGRKLGAEEIPAAMKELGLTEEPSIAGFEMSPEEYAKKFKAHQKN